MASTSRVGCLFFMLLGALLRICTHTHSHPTNCAVIQHMLEHRSGHGNGSMVIRFADCQPVPGPKPLELKLSQQEDPL